MGTAKLIVIDGLDGSGKATQVGLLANYLRRQGKTVYIIDFPDYESDSSAPVQMYLHGEISKNPSDINAYAASSFYAVDRVIQYIADWKSKYLEEDAIIIANRYLSANIIHQGTKIAPLAAKIDFFEWVYEYETELLGLPVEDITIYLKVDTHVSRNLILKRYNNDESKMDIHESDLKYLEKCSENADVACRELNKLGYNWQTIDCCAGCRPGEINSVEHISNQIISKLKHENLI